MGPGGATTKSVFAGSQRVAALTTDDGLPTTDLKFYHGDHLGSSNVITDGTGTLIELAEYRPYGALARREGAVEVPQKFTGQRLDASTGLYFYNARYYDPGLGRFISADPVVPSPGDPQALNRYSYVRNNPIHRTDPTGHCEAVCQTIIFVVTVVAASLFGGGGEPEPQAPPGPVQATAFTALEPATLLGSVGGVAALPIGATKGSFLPGTEAFPAEPSTKPYGFVNELSDAFHGAFTAQFFAAPTLRALGWAGRLGQGALMGLGERGAARLALGAAGRELPQGVKALAEANITRSGKTVLGHFPGYITKARARGASYFDIGKAWDRLTDAQRWAANRHFLDKITAARDQVFLSIPKKLIRPNSSLAREVDYLIREKGYRWLNQWSLVPK